MCPGQQEGAPTSSEPSVPLDDSPPEWETIELPPIHILAHLTDAHCHPTDLTHAPSVYDGITLGGIAAMATVPEDQPRVADLARSRPWLRPSTSGELSRTHKDGVRVVACFGYHPWFSHRYTTADPAPSKRDHYTSIFFPSTSTAPRTKERQLLETLLPYLPDPIPFGPLVDKLRADITASLDQGQLTMLGEVGLDGGARVRWPLSAKHLYPERVLRNPNPRDHDAPAQAQKEDEADEEEEEEEWKRLTPLKVSMSHQTELLSAQMEVALEMGVNVSFHSVAAPGPTMDVLKRFRDKHGVRFTNRINVDLHSAGGWSPEFWSQAEKQVSNLYASPSIFITGRSTSAPALIRAISTDRILVESDSHDVRLTPRLVWAATKWISTCKGWKLEEGSQEWSLIGDPANEVEVEPVEGSGKDGVREMQWTVRTLERNWARFMGLIDAAD